MNYELMFISYSFGFVMGMLVMNFLHKRKSIKYGAISEVKE